MRQCFGPPCKSIWTRRHSTISSGLANRTRALGDGTQVPRETSFTLHRPESHRDGDVCLKHVGYSAPKDAARSNICIINTKILTPLGERQYVLQGTRTPIPPASIIMFHLVYGASPLSPSPPSPSPWPPKGIHPAPFLLPVGTSSVRAGEQAKVGSQRKIPTAVYYSGHRSREP